jgi:agmatine deiminase
MTRVDPMPFSTPEVRVPAEWEQHACCWMAWAVHTEWHGWTRAIKDELSSVIHTIARFEPIRLLTPREILAEARARFSGSNIEVVEAPVDDIWMRDIAPTFARRGNDVVAIDWNFNGWGVTRPSRAGDRLAEMAKSIFGVARVSVPFVCEGGAFITDGHGTLVTTRSCLLNPNRNAPSSSRNREKMIERSLARLGFRRIIWLEGDPSEPITSGHVDGYVMFTPTNALVEVVEDEQCRPPQWRDHDIAILERAQDAAGHQIKVGRVRAPRKRYWRFRGPYWAPCYLNAYVTNGAVITAAFGDVERDEAAKDALAQAFPRREIVMMRIDHIANGGGGIHCLTQPMPA